MIQNLERIFFLFGSIFIKRFNKNHCLFDQVNPLDPSYKLVSWFFSIRFTFMGHFCVVMESDYSQFAKFKLYSRVDQVELKTIPFKPQIH